MADKYHPGKEVEWWLENVRDLNKACSKDLYPPPNIDHLVDGASRFGMLSFRDTFTGYKRKILHTLILQNQGEDTSLVTLVSFPPSGQ